MPTPPANGRGKEEGRKERRGREVKKNREECMVEGGKGGSKEEEREEGEERGSGERKGGVNGGMSLTYTLFLRGKDVPTTYMCTQCKTLQDLHRA